MWEKMCVYVMLQAYFLTIGKTPQILIPPVVVS